jgi:hypothetical protein
MHHVIELTYQGDEIVIFALTRPDGDELVYDLYSDDLMLGTLRPTLGEDPVTVWTGDESIPADLVRLIGQRIENQDW